MKSYFLKLPFTFKVMVITAVMSFSNASYAVDTINGNACIAANLAQAQELMWDQARVLNPATNPNSRFVTCTLTSGNQYLRNDMSALGITTVESGTLVAFFSADSAPGAEASCIFREMAGTATTSAGADTVVAVITADDPLPDTNGGSFAVADGIDIGVATSLTVTCLLDPGVGINAYTALHTIAP